MPRNAISASPSRKARIASGTERPRRDRTRATTHQTIDDRSTRRVAIPPRRRIRGPPRQLVAVARRDNRRISDRSNPARASGTSVYRNMFCPGETEPEFLGVLERCLRLELCRNALSVPFARVLCFALERRGASASAASASARVANRGSGNVRASTACNSARRRRRAEHGRASRRLRVRHHVPHRGRIRRRGHPPWRASRSKRRRGGRPPTYSGSVARPRAQLNHDGEFAGVARGERRERRRGGGRRVADGVEVRAGGHVEDDESKPETRRRHPRIESRGRRRGSRPRREPVGFDFSPAGRRVASPRRRRIYRACRGVARRSTRIPPRRGAARTPRRRRRPRESCEVASRRGNRRRRRRRRSRDVPRGGLRRGVPSVCVPRGPRPRGSPSRHRRRARAPAGFYLRTKTPEEPS